MGVSGAVVIGSVVAGAMAADASKAAAETQAGAGRAAIASQERALAEQRQLMEPFRQAGLGALQDLISGTSAGGEFRTKYPMADAMSMVAKPFEMKTSETQKFVTQEALDAMRSQMALGGQALSSQAISGAGKLAGNIAGQFENQAFNQYIQEQQMGLTAQGQSFDQWLRNRQANLGNLQWMAGMGERAATGTAQDVGQTGTAVAGLQTDIGAAQAAGQIGQANAMQQTLSGLTTLGTAGIQSGRWGGGTTNQPLPTGGMTATGTTPMGDYWGTKSTGGSDYLLMNQILGGQTGTYR